MSLEERRERADRCKNRVWTNESREKLRARALEKPTIQHALTVANRPDRDRTGLNNPRANEEVWTNLETLREIWLNNNKCGAKRLFTQSKIGNTWQSLKTVVKRFKEEDDIV
jgi:hypothetical protein